MIKNYFEGDYHEIKKLSGLSNHELFWFDIDEKDKDQIERIKLTHWGYFEHGTLIEIIYMQKKNINYLKAKVRTKAHLQTLLKMTKHFLHYICIDVLKIWIW